MPTLTAMRPPDTHTHAAGFTPGISATEADLIAAAAWRFLERAEPGFRQITTADIGHHISTLIHPYTRASIGDYDCEKPNDTHWCSSR